MLLTAGGAAHHLEQSKSTAFCLTCHIMEPYGESLESEDADLLASVHFQNRLVDTDSACFTCHTSYAMYGDVAAKWAGARHMMVQYFGTPSHPIELYQPYRNRECLHCHDGAQRFEENEFHTDIRVDLGSEEISCLECHGPAHGVSDDVARLAATGGNDV